MQDRTLTLIADDGKEIVCDILFTYFWEQTKKDYVVFQVRGEATASAAIYYPQEDGQGRLEKIETEEEWTMLEELLEDYASQMPDDEEESGCSGHCQGCSGCSGSGECDGDCDCDGECNK